MRIVIYISLIIILIVPLSSHAVKPRPGKPYEGPESIPATIKNIYYVTGLPEIDVRKYAKGERYKGWFELEKNELAFKRNRMKQTGEKGLESVDILRINYSSIYDLWFGYDAIYRVANSTLPSALQQIYDPWLGVNLTLNAYLKKKSQSPVIIFFKRNNQKVSLVLLASHGRAKALYQLIANQSGLKVKPPITSQDKHSADPVN